MPTNPYSEALENKGKALFIPFTVLGDPNKKESLEIVRTLINSGADALELGFPFSDPPADGPVIQSADTRALEAGIKVDDCFDLLKSIRKETEAPIGLLIYYNLILQRGIDKFYSNCKESGVTSVLIADLPIEHANEVVNFAKKYDIAPVFIVSELTSDERLKKIVKITKGYLYLVSYVGITGVEDSVLESKIANNISRIRKYSNLPICVGFGINTAEQVKAVAKAGADGVIVGSRLVKEIPNKDKIFRICEELKSSI